MSSRAYSRAIALGTSEYVALLSATALSGHRVHILLSAMWGFGLLLEVAVRLVVISRVSVDVANGLTSAISWATSRS